jgi:tetratricopeptide (TPR) repeat protein
MSIGETTPEQPAAAALTLNERGKKLAEEGAYQPALEAFFAAIDADPDFAAPYNNVAAMCLQIGSHDQALVYAAKALDLAPMDRSIFLACGEILARTGHVDKARELYETYLLHFPGDAELEAGLSGLPMATR